MSDLLTTEEGRNAVLEAQRFLLRRRLSRFFKRNLVVTYTRYMRGGQFNIAGILGELNKLNDPEIIELYRLLGLSGGLEQTIADIDVYVDSINGNDETGNGSASHPFRSFWFINSLPRKIAHSVRIFINQDINVPESINLNVEFINNGRIYFVGIGDPVVLNSDEITDIDIFRARNCFNSVNARPADLYNCFVHFKTGNLAGRVLPEINTEMLYSYESAKDTALSPAIGDEFDIIRPGRTLTLSGLIIDTKGNVQPSVYTSIIPQTSRVVFENLTIKNNPAGSYNPYFYVSGNTAFEFVSIIVSNSLSPWVFSGQINGTHVANYTGLTFVNFGDGGLTVRNIGFIISQESFNILPAICDFKRSVSVNAMSIRSDMLLTGLIQLSSNTQSLHMMRRVDLLGNTAFRNSSGELIYINSLYGTETGIIQSILKLEQITTSSKITLRSFSMFNSQTTFRNWDDISDLEALPADQRGGINLDANSTAILNGQIPINTNADALRFQGLAVAVETAFPAENGREDAANLNSLVIRPESI